MARNDQQKKGEWASFFATLLIVGFVLTWALIPVALVESTWQAEQSQMASWAGASADHWIRAQAADLLGTAAKDAQRTVAGLGKSAVEQWLANRVYVGLLWVNITLYRTCALLLWSFLGIPLIMATSVDGYYVREIRKTAFISQSPIRHKIGVHFFRLVSIAIVIWLCLPIPMPIVVAPLVVGFMSFSMWLWVSHLQKRL